ncbi:MAG: PhoD-like phosphatase [Verrucomicrobia bacterium]|nr:MAG: PhoD-like phosphatase [Verrucomicrobiota bacterium]
MIQTLTRRLSLKILSLGTFFGVSRRADCVATPGAVPIQGWASHPDRVWLGAEVWANPMEDWRISGGWAECTTSGSGRNVHSLTHQIAHPAAGFVLSVVIARPEGLAPDGGAGFRIGIRSDLNEYRSSCFAKGGLDAGWMGNELFLGEARVGLGTTPAELRLTLTGEAEKLTLRAHRLDGGKLGEVTIPMVPETVIGNIALVSQFSGPPKRAEAKGYRFREWEVAGEAFTATPDQALGPILWSMYSLSDTRGEEGFVLKLSALTPPLGDQDGKTVELRVKRGDQWESLATADLDRDAWVASFRIPQWEAASAVPFQLKLGDAEWSGSIRANPQGRPLRVAALTCQNDYAFPYAPVAENLLKLDPDLLYFSGDQLYENHGGFGIIREPSEPAILNYLRKFYQFGWAFREVMRDRPTLCIPDDHDVFQGNIWGEGGAPMQGLDQGASSKGGYREPARMVNVVHKTNAGHHPDPFDAKPALQDISVYYGEVLFGGVSFAVIADRQWKSGPERVATGSGRADHVVDPGFDTATLDQPGLVLLGDRQEEFLRQWSADWRGHTMKVLLSQTVFAGVATHHGKYDGYLKADLDSGGWPQTARNRAIGILRSSMALHINGDQHLASLSQYGVEKQRDSNWSFCTPAIAAGYPRWWRPDEVGMAHQNRPAHGLDFTGEYLDGLGNRIYVYAIGNPEPGTAKNRYALAHQKGSGFGLVEIDGETRTYTIHCYRFLIDATDGKPGNEFPGWPVTVRQAENRGENFL